MAPVVAFSLVGEVLWNPIARVFTTLKSLLCLVSSTLLVAMKFKRETQKDGPTNDTNQQWLMEVS